MADPTTPSSSGVRSFLRENWLYIVVPLAIVFVLLLALILFGDDSRSKFIYNLW